MTFDKEPYFMTNSEWYYYDIDEGCYRLTDKAPDKAKKSYKDFYSELRSRYGESS